VDEKDWLTSDDPECLLELLIYELRVAERKLRLFACACCERISQYVDPSLVVLLGLAERYADGLIDAFEMTAAHDSARRQFGTWDTNDPHYRPREAANEAFILAAEVCPERSNPHRNHLVPFAYESSGLAAITLEHASRSYDALRNESAHQCILLHEIFGNPFRPVTFHVAWRTTDVMILARGIYHEKDFDRIPILADALQEAGCNNDDLLNHLRDTSATHVRGCWALDLVLGKA
jgi:hypothetical protein